MTTDRDRIVNAAPLGGQAPASGRFGFTEEHLVRPRATLLDAEMFARFYAESEQDGTSRLVTKEPPARR